MIRSNHAASRGNGVPRQSSRAGSTITLGSSHQFGMHGIALDAPQSTFNESGTFVDGAFWAAGIHWDGGDAA